MEYSELLDATLGTIRAWTRLVETGRLGQGQFLQNLSVGGISIAISNAVERNSGRTPQTGAWASDNALSDMDRLNIRTILWQLVGQGVLVPGRIGDPTNQFFEPTPYGREVLLADTSEGPYDPMGFLSGLRAEAPGIEESTLELIEEAVRAYFSGLLRSAAVMTGVASELEILRLADLVADSLSPVERDSYIRTMERSRNLAEKFRVLLERLNQIRKSLPRDLQDLDVWLEGAFHLIRIYRNEAGHPIGVTASRNEVYLNLSLFRTYGRKLSALKQHLAAANDVADPSTATDTTSYG